MEELIIPKIAFEIYWPLLNQHHLMLYLFGNFSTFLVYIPARRIPKSSAGSGWNILKNSLGRQFWLSFTYCLAWHETKLVGWFPFSSSSHMVFFGNPKNLLVNLLDKWFCSLQKPLFFAWWSFALQKGSYIYYVSRSGWVGLANGQFFRYSVMNQCWHALCCKCLRSFAFF